VADETTAGTLGAQSNAPQGTQQQNTTTDDDSSIAIKALQDLVVAVNSLVQTVTKAT
jgi:hypothetical protein